jgi:hypothetical protein
VVTKGRVIDDPENHDGISAAFQLMKRCLAEENLLSVAQVPVNMLEELEGRKSVA